jgi:hypothetical protein
MRSAIGRILPIGANPIGGKRPKVAVEVRMGRHLTEARPITSNYGPQSGSL